MSDEILVRVDGVSKKFCRSLKKSLWYGLRDVAAEALPFGRISINNTDQAGSGLRAGEFWAVNSVSFELRRGECLGLLGHNGAGKTTLLKLLNGLIKPDKGRISMSGNVGALIALGAGFNPILSGRENIYVNASILGLKKSDIDGKLDEIIEFAGLEEFIDMPVQSYSSGMQVRLGFSVATTMNPDILLVDEVLAVGDADFRSKCYDRLEKLRPKTAIILVSHNRHDIVRTCNNALLMSRGEMATKGAVGVTLDHYETKAASSGRFARAHDGFNLISAQIEKTRCEWGERLGFSMEITSSHVVRGATMRLSIMDPSETCVAEWRSEYHNVSIQIKPGLNRFNFEIGSVRLRPGIYCCNFIISQKDIAQYLVLAYRHCELVIVGAGEGFSHYQM